MQKAGRGKLEGNPTPEMLYVLKLKGIGSIAQQVKYNTLATDRNLQSIYCVKI
jgi:hypothetical protein